VEEFTWYHVLMIVTFIAGYTLIALEHLIQVNKTAVALLAASICWFLFFSVESDARYALSCLNGHLANESQIVFFLLGAMTLVEVIDSHDGFWIVSQFIRTHSKTKMLWISGILTFFLSSVMDNLASTIIVLSMMRRLVAQREDRWMLGSVVVIAANAGGAWSPIGDVTTTMLWMHGKLHATTIMANLIVPSCVCLVSVLVYHSFFITGELETTQREDHHKKEGEPFSGWIFCLGVFLLLLVPVVKAVLGLPPFMGMLIAVSILWLVTDFLHPHEHRTHLRIPHALSRIDSAGLLFFLGILLAVDSLQSSGLLEGLAISLERWITDSMVLALCIGLISSILDNVPLVSAMIGMYPEPTDHLLWKATALASGTGGSILIIGSAAGIALMGIEKVDFLWYLRRMSLSALVSYLASISVLWVQACVF